MDTGFPPQGPKLVTGIRLDTASQKPPVSSGNRTLPGLGHQHRAAGAQEGPSYGRGDTSTFFPPRLRQHCRHKESGGLMKTRLLSIFPGTDLRPDV